MKTQIIPAGTILKFMGELPVELVHDTEVKCGTNLGEWQDMMVSEPRASEGGDELNRETP